MIGPQVWKLLFDVIVREMNEVGCMIAYADDGVIGGSRREWSEGE